MKPGRQLTKNEFGGRLCTVLRELAGAREALAEARWAGKLDHELRESTRLDLEHLEYTVQALLDRLFPIVTQEDRR